MCINSFGLTRDGETDVLLFCLFSDTDFSAAQAYRLLTPAQQAIADNSTITYAPHALYVLPAA